MDSSREANRKQREDEKREDDTTSLVDLNLMVVLLSQLCTTNGDDKGSEKERRDSVAHEARESRARANKRRLMKETKLMEKRTHVLQPMAKEFRHSRKM